MARLASVSGLERFRSKVTAESARKKTEVHVCMTGCRAYGAAAVRDALVEEVSRRGIDDSVEIRSTGCHGFCAKAPVIAIEPDGLQYQEVDPADAAEIVGETLIRHAPVARLAYKDPATGEPVYHRNRIPFYRKQLRRVLALCGRIDPTRIDQYIAAGGYTALAEALARMTPEAVVEQVMDSGLRGRGGAGFPTGLKWRLARQAEGRPKYMVCNADEGDPGAFMDRAILEGDPHAVIEGMLLGGYAIGAEQGFIYVREEYPIAVEHLTVAIAAAESLGLLGENILGTGRDFHLSLKMGAGAFVCGEETALMASIEGRRGMPTPRPPFPAQSGIDGKPTNINNVETLANIPLIIRNGADWYAGVGTENSKGTKIFSLAGKVSNTGLVEVPIGTPIREVVFDIGGGVPKGRRFKAVQMGGPAGGCVSARFLNTPIDYDTLQRIGAIMGSGGMVVMDENNCMVEIARFFLNFSQSESCGKCAPCRLGTTQMLEILTRITLGKAKTADLETLKSISGTMMETSLCGLGQAAPRPVLSTLRYFEQEYRDHILEHRCAGAVCDVMVISACQHACPAGVDIPNCNAAIAAGDFDTAVAIIRERNPFPAVCGRVCVNPCEYKCRRGELDEPVAIRSLKRFAADRHYEKRGAERVPFPVTHAEKVAVVGAGPSGLACAYFLARAGYETTVFEAQPVPGGMLSIALPEFRLPRQVIEMDIRHIQSAGVDIRCNSPIDADHTVDDLLKEGFSAVFIAAGAQASRRIGIPGEEEDPDGLLYGLGFLREIRAGEGRRLSGKTVVIGGGNVAVDAARTAVRSGAREVQLFCLETRGEMPAWDKDIEEAEEEGVIINTSWSPGRIVTEGGRVKAVRFFRCLSVFDEEGRFSPAFDETDTLYIEADTVVVSIGQAPDMSFLPEDSRLERALWGTLAVDENTLATNIPGVFAGGDFTAGPTFLIRAIASGRRAAVAIDRYLSGDLSPILMPDETTPLARASRLALDAEPTTGQHRAEIEIEPARERAGDFREVERGLAMNKALFEAGRCLRCDLEIREE